MSRDNLYNLKVGIEGEEQLNNLERAYGKSSRLFLNNIGIQAGMKVIDVGCGVGHMSCWLAQQVGSAGHIYAIDNSQKQLDIATKKAKSKNLSNISFHLANASDLSDFAEISDLTYCRWLLFHVKNPKQTCISMGRTVKKSGILACEAGSAGTNVFYPRFEAHDIVMSKFYELMKKVHNDPLIGLNVLRIFQSLNEFMNIELSVSQNAWTKPDDVMQFLKGMITALDSASDSLIKNNILSQSEIISLKDSISSHQPVPGTLVMSTRITQIHAKKIRTVAAKY